MRKLWLIAILILLSGCDGNSESDEGGVESIDEESSSQSNSTFRSIDASAVGPDLKGVEFVDKKGNKIATFFSDHLPDDSVKMVDGVDLGKAGNYEIITNQFVELTYPVSSREYRQVITVEPVGKFTTVFTFDENDMLMVKTPYVRYESGQVKFKASTVNGKVTFALVNIE